MQTGAGPSAATQFGVITMVYVYKYLSSAQEIILWGLTLVWLPGGDLTWEQRMGFDSFAFASRDGSHVFRTGGVFSGSWESTNC